MDRRDPWIALRNLWILTLRRNPWIEQGSNANNVNILRPITDRQHQNSVEHGPDAPSRHVAAALLLKFGTCA